MSGRETFDVSAKEKRILEYRAARRTRLRAEYLQQVGNPYRMGMEYSGTVFDLGIQRYLSMRETAIEHFRPNVKSSIWSFSLVILPIALAAYWIIGSRRETERKYRSGQVSYRDRPFKFF